MSVARGQEPATLSLARAATLGFTALLVGVGIGRFGYPALIPAIVGAGWVTPEVAHLSAASNLAGYVAGALFCAYAVRRIGARLTVVLSLWLTVASFALSAVPLPAFLFAALRFLSGLTGGALMTAVAPLVALRVDPSKRGRAGGYAFAGIGIGFILSGALVPALADRGVGAAWMAIALVLAIASVIGWRTLPPDDPPRLARETIDDIALKPEKLNWAAIGLAIAYASSAVGYVPATVVFVDYVGRVLGLGLTTAGAVWIATGCGAVASPLLAGFLADRYGFAWTLRIVLMAMGIGAAIPAFTNGAVWLALSGLLAGGMMIALASLMSGRTREITTPSRHAAVWARMTVIFALTQAAAAYAVSGLLGWSGNYRLIFLIGGAVMLAGAAIEFGLARLDRDMRAPSA